MNGSHIREPWVLEAEELIPLLSSDAKRGLEPADAAARLREHGPNELESEAGPSAWRRFLAQFQNALVLLLLFATAISLGLWVYERETPLPYDAIAIFAVVILNAALGFVQESRAASAVAALRNMTAATARVLRGGQQVEIEARAVVPGDVLVIEEGDTIAADGRLFRSAALHTAESALTGESLPVSKEPARLTEAAGIGDRHNMVFSGTAVTSGRGRALVTGTGMNTEMGHIAGLLHQTAQEATPLQRELDRVGKLLGGVVMVIAVVMIATLIVVEHLHGFRAIFDALILGVALAVAAVPEGLPAVVSAVLSLGVQRAAQRKAIVRRLSAVETLGSANVIASDKTGTLTKNEMTVRVVVTASGRVALSGTGYSSDGALTREGGGAIEGAFRIELERTLTAGSRANNALLKKDAGRVTVQGDPTEGALKVAAQKAGLDEAALEQRFQRLAEVPFTSERKLMSTLHSDAQQTERLVSLTKGAPDVLLDRCTHELVGEEIRPLDAARRAELLELNEELAAEALRTLGVGFRIFPKAAFDLDEVDERVEAELVFLGLFGMIDPPREEAKAAVARARRAGIRPIMITGDHPVTAAVIAKELGIVDEGAALSGAELTIMKDAALDRAVRETSVFARVSPEHKLRIVRALRRSGAIVAMTGDGVNDAPALKTADIGIAMGITGTDVAKQAADMVLADDNFATIVAAVEEGRAIYSNIRKFLRYLLASNLGEVMTMFFGVVFAEQLGLKAASTGAVVLPLLATQLLWINLVSDGAPALALGIDPVEHELMDVPPRPRSERVISARMWGSTVFIGAVSATAALGVLDASLPGGLIEGTGTLRYAQTMAFNTVVFAALFTVFNARSDDRSAFRGMFSNPWLWGAIGVSLLAQVAVIYLPFLQAAFSTTALSVRDWLVCAAAGSAVLWLRELSKLVLRLFVTTSRRPLVGPIA
ncbi:MAG TPA: cation-translocating P-type ATPase [Polyangiales bacterium]|nr:cation-translocating P-type ATPase [Polyangiales bacterium]